MDPRKEGGNPQQYIEMEAPDFLEEGENFFSYPPFSMVIKALAEQTVFESVDLGRLINYLSSSPDRLEPDSIERAVEFVRRGKEGMYPKSAARKGIRSLTIALSPFPDWNEYVKTRQLGGQYKDDGTYNLQRKSFTPTPSYPAWLAERIRIDRSLAMRGVLMEVFSQQLGGASLSDAVGQSGRGSVRKKWVIRGGL